MGSKQDKEAIGVGVVGEISAAVIEGEAQEIEKLVEQALEGGKTAQEILDEGLIPAMDHVGMGMKNGSLFIPEVLLSARVMQAALKILKPVFLERGGKMKGRVLLGTVKGDIHNLGKNLVNVMLKGAGFDVIDLGVDVSTEKFVDAVNSEKAQLVGMSALLTVTMPYMRTTIEALEEAGLKGKVKTIIGGACVTQQYADEIGADGYAENAGAAVGKARELLGLK